MPRRFYSDEFDQDELNVLHTRKEQKPEETPKKEEKQDAKNPREFLKIVKIDSSKDAIRQPQLSEMNVIPRLGTMSIFNGMTGSGKTNLINNLLTKPQFFGQDDIFSIKILISPTANADDMQKSINFDIVKTDLKEGEKVIVALSKIQREEVEKYGNDKAGNALIYFDDVISDNDFIKSKAYTHGAIASRHDNITSFTSSQSWTSVPRKARLQAKNIFFFASSQSEVELLHYEYCPPNMSKKDFMDMVAYATSDPFSFLYINKSVPMKIRFRKNLDEIIDLDRFRNHDVNKRSGIKSGRRPKSGLHDGGDQRGFRKKIKGERGQRRQESNVKDQYRSEETDQEYQTSTGQYI